MKQSFLKIAKCPNCGGDFVLENKPKNNSEEIINGTLICETCKNKIPIQQGIPRFIGGQNYADSFGFQWNKHAKAQVDKYNGYKFSTDRFFSVTNWSKNLKGQCILEAGSGAGRFTQVICETGADLFTFDYSTAVDANLKNNGEYENLNIFQGDIYNIPLKKNTFDKVICFGVIQHTPNVKESFMSLTNFIKPGGELAIDVYEKKLRYIIAWKYLLRPITKRMNGKFLYKLISLMVPLFLPLSNILIKIFGKSAWRMFPITNYYNLGIPHKMNVEWSILDTFDMYSPAHDHPQSKETIETWFKEAGLENIVVEKGPNGLMGTGIKPKKEIPVQELEAHI